jgi:hypothetical protein
MLETNMSNFVQVTELEMHMYANIQCINIYIYIYICKQTLQCLNSCNFIQCINAQMRIWSILIPRYTPKDSIDICFIFSD